MLSKPGFKKNSLKSKQERSPHWKDLVYISFCIDWEGHKLSDQFLWPVNQTSVYEMKVFAVNYLAEYLKNKLKLY